MKGSIPLVSFAALSAVSARTLTFKNSCSYTVWPTIFTHLDVLDQPSWREDALGSSVSFDVPDNWTAGRIWPRTECDSSISGPQACVSDGCSGGPLCDAHPGTGVPTAAAPEFTLSGGGTTDNDPVSLVDGPNVNVPLTVASNNVPSCPVDRDQDPNCPAVLSVDDAADKIAGSHSSDLDDPSLNSANHSERRPHHLLFVASSNPLLDLSLAGLLSWAISMTPSTMTLFLVAVAGLTVYALIQALSPLVSIYRHHRAAQAVGLPVKILPVPPGVFPFFAFQVLKRFGLVTPGGAIEKMFNVGRPDGFGMHGELGDTFLTVSAMGVGLVTADPKVASYVSARREQFPKPPNTGALINLYGKNVINARGDQWRVHRKVTGPVFSEKIHRDVWNEATRQAGLMLNAWKSSSDSDEFVLDQLEDDALRLGLNVITGAAYGVPLGWDENPPTVEKSTMSFRRSIERLTVHLMPLFLTPRWALRLAPRSTNWGQAWEAYTAFGGYMLGMLDLARQKREKNEKDEGDNLMTVLTQAEENQELDPTEVLGNAFIFLFAGHETTANTLHYALLLLALHPEVQTLVQAEIDELYGTRNSLDYDDFPHTRWITAVMNETLRCFSPTSMVNKWTDAPTPIPYGKGTVVLPPHTRVSTNITGIHANPAVWGPDVKEWRPARWIAPTVTDYFRSPPPSPRPMYLQEDSPFGSRPSTPMTPAFSRSPSPACGGVGLIKPAKGTFLPFSEGSRMCSGRKFAAVEFCAVLCTILREHRLEMPRGWSEEKMWSVLRGRKPGALTLQPPEAVPIVLVPRRR